MFPRGGERGGRADASREKFGRERGPSSGFARGVRRGGGHRGGSRGGARGGVVRGDVGVEFGGGAGDERDVRGGHGVARRPRGNARRRQDGVQVARRGVFREGHAERRGDGERGVVHRGGIGGIDGIDGSRPRGRRLRLRGREEHLDASVTHRAGNFAASGIEREKQAEVRVRGDDPRLAVAHAALADEERSADLEERVESVEHRRRTQVGVLEEHPLAVHRGFEQDAVHPLETPRRGRGAAPSLGAEARQTRAKRSDRTLANIVTLVHGVVVVVTISRGDSESTDRDERGVQRRLGRLGVFRARALRGRVDDRAVPRPSRPRGFRRARRAVFVVLVRIVGGSVRRLRLGRGRQGGGGGGAERGERLRLERRAIPRGFFLFKRTQELGRVRGGGERHLSQRSTREARQRLHERRLTARRRSDDDGHPSARRAVRRRFQRAQLSAEKTEGRVALGVGGGAAAREHRVAHAKRAVANRHRGRRRRRRRSTKRRREKPRALGAIRGGSKSTDEQSGERGVHRALGGVRRELVVRRAVFEARVRIVRRRRRRRRLGQVAPTQQVAKVKLPRRARPGERSARDGRRRGERGGERHHAFDDGRGYARVERARDVHEIRRFHRFHVHARESIEEGFRETLAPAALLHGVLRGEDAKRRRAPERLPELGHEHLRAVVERGVQTFQDGLRREVELVEQHPISVFERRQERTVRPSKLAGGAPVGGQIRAEKIHHVRLFAQVDAHEVVPRRLGERGHQTRLTDAGRTLEKDGFGKLHRAKKTSGVATRRRRREFETQRRTRDDGRAAAGNGEGGDAEETVAIDEFAVAAGGRGVAGVGRRLDRRVCLRVASEGRVGVSVSQSPGERERKKTRRVRGVRNSRLGFARGRAARTGRVGPSSSVRAFGRSSVRAFAVGSRGPRSSP